MDSLKPVIEWYDNSRSYAYMPKEVEGGLKKWERNVVKDFFKEYSHILDIGCGMGREAFALYDKGFRVTATDISLPVLEQAKMYAKQTSRNIDFNINDNTKLPFDDLSFDTVIIWSQTFGLLYGQENQLRMLKECKRVLKNNGILCFSGHDRGFLQQTYPQYIKDEKFYAYADTDCYWEAFYPQQLADRAEQTGFNVLSCEKGYFDNPDEGNIIYCVCQK